MIPFKLYDYSKKRNKGQGVREKMWDWVDEDLRRLWDVVYNKREQYDGQLGGSSPDLAGSLKEVFRNRGWMALVANYSNSPTGIGCTASKLNSQPSAIDPDINNMYNLSSASGSSDCRFSCITPIGSFGHFDITHDPYFSALIKSDTNIADTKMLIGVAEDTTVMPTNYILPNGQAPYANFTGFHYNSAVSPNWKVTARFNRTAAIFTDTTIPLAVSTTYFLEMLVSGNGTLAEFAINGVVVASISFTAGTSQSGIGMSPTLALFAIGATTHSLRLSRLYCEFGHINY